MRRSSAASARGRSEEVQDAVDEQRVETRTDLDAVVTRLCRGGVDRDHDVAEDTPFRGVVATGTGTPATRPR